VIGMLDDETNPTTRGEVLRHIGSGDFIALAREMRDSGVESLLLCNASGRIEQVLTDRQVAHLSANPDPAPLRTSSSSAVSAGTERPPAHLEPVTSVPVIRRQGRSVRFGHTVPASRG